MTLPLKDGTMIDVEWHSWEDKLTFRRHGWLYCLPPAAQEYVNRGVASQVAHTQMGLRVLLKEEISAAEALSLIDTQSAFTPKWWPEFRASLRDRVG